MSKYWFTAVNELNSSKNELGAITKSDNTELDAKKKSNYSSLENEPANSFPQNEKRIYLNNDESLANITYKHPKVFCIENTIFQIKSWKDIYRDTCAYLYDKFKEEFINRIKSKTSATIIDHKENLYGQIGNSNYFIYLNVNGTELVKRSKKFLSWYSIPLDQCYYVIRDEE